MLPARLLLLWLTVLLAGAACSAGGDGAPGDDGLASTGGFAPGTGGFVAGAAGVVTSGGNVGSGGTSVGAGGAVASAGGVFTGNGGSSVGNGGVPAATGGTPGGQGGSVSVGPYPPGPYGNTVGATLANLTLAGYRNDSGLGLASAQPWVDAYTMDDLRAGGAPYALVHVSEFL